MTTHSLTPSTTGTTVDLLSPWQAFQEARTLYRASDFCGALTRLRYVIRFQRKDSPGYRAVLRLALQVFCAMGDAAAAERVYDRLAECEKNRRREAAGDRSTTSDASQPETAFRPLRTTRSRSWHVRSLDALTPSTCFHLRLPGGTRTSG